MFVPVHDDSSSFVNIIDFAVLGSSELEINRENRETTFSRTKAVSGSKS